MANTIDVQLYDIVGIEAWSYYDSDSVSGRKMARLTNTYSETRIITSVSFYLGKGARGTAHGYGDTVYSDGSNISVSFSAGGHTTTPVTVSANCPLVGSAKTWWEYTYRSGGAVTYPLYVELYTFTFPANDRPVLPAGGTVDVTINCYTAGSAFIRYMGDGYASATSIPSTINVKSVTIDTPSPVELCTKSGYGYPTSKQLEWTVLPTNATNKAVNWSSSNGEIASVDTNGKVTAKGKGECTITVTTVDGGKTATCKVIVYAVSTEKPTIISPTGTGKWYGNNGEIMFKIVFQMPEDINYSDLSPTEQKNYRYKNATVQVNNTSYSILNNPEMFSVAKTALTHKCIVIMSYSGTPTGTSTSLKITAQYGGKVQSTSEAATLSCPTTTIYPTIERTVGSAVRSALYVKKCEVINNMLAFVIPSTDSLYMQLSTASITGYEVFASKYPPLRDALHRVYEFMLKYGATSDTVTFSNTYIQRYQTKLANIITTAGSEGDYTIQNPTSRIQFVAEGINSITELLEIDGMTAALSNYYEVPEMDISDYPKTLMKLDLVLQIYTMIINVLGGPDPNE